MDSRVCIGVLWDHKNGTFDKLKNFTLKLNKRPLNICGKIAKNCYFQPQNCHFFILRHYLELKGDKNEIQFFPGNF